MLAGDQQLARAELDLARTTMLQAAADVRGADADIAARGRLSRGAGQPRSHRHSIADRWRRDWTSRGSRPDDRRLRARAGALHDRRSAAHAVARGSPEGEVGGVQRGSQVRFDIESIGGHPFTGTVAEVRLAPQVAASTASNAGTSSNRHQLEPGHRTDRDARPWPRPARLPRTSGSPTGGLDDDRQRTRSPRARPRLCRHP